MKKFLTAVLSATTLLAQAPQPAPTGDVIGVGNFAHIVADLDRSLEFYREVLGLEVLVNQPFAKNLAIEKLGNTMGGQSRYTALKVPNSQMGVELIEYKDIERKPQSPRFQDPGAANFIIRVRDIDSLFARFQKYQAKQKAARVITVAGKPVNVANSPHVFLQDPDGFVVEVAQETAKEGAPSGDVLGGGFELAIADTDKSVKFYNEILGFSMKSAAAFNDNKTMADTAGVPGGKFRQSRSPIPGSTSGVTLIEFAGVDRKPLTGRVQDPGTAILQLRVADVTALIKKLKAAGVPVTTVGGEPVDVGPGLKIAIVRDPNNLYLELVQSPQK
jgi:catechol 2,3-dioxygenase-like lactoylglutathione lyase family enzyme